MKAFWNFLASGFGVSLLPATILKGHKNTGAGFWGTLVAVPFAWWILMPLAWWAQLIFIILFTFFAVYVTKKASFEGHDSPKIVIDEMAGYFFAVFYMPRTAFFVVAAFVLFRIFDWLKPLFIKYFDNMQTASGVVLDDVASGVLANVILWAVFWACVGLGLM
ncbi:Phosphatidylglycerophosphate synthase [Elusimicrobium minutum Pei191]|uniref:Phosphatidylglycerophosphate synthase n=1 Tax=Elusimicrobium minutum (strain Pei191) TaxID=445932 RepID=B2KBH7_ELUMP|nr:phosphatidylglycerophosphatase A [Elusimicrobium minutum]ACC97999.1 Phosphatidylglycerophosphate synthase [Elusimicrobium minutum Pei191]